MEQTWHAGLFTRRFGPSPHEDVPVVVLVHGLGLSGRYFVPLARRLAAGGASVLVPDLPGNAWSRSAARRAPDVEGVADALAHWHRGLSLPPCLFVGNSVGCQVIAAFAARHPHLVRGAVLIGPALDPDASGWRQAGRLLADAPREPLSLLAVATADYLLTGPVRFAASFRHALRDAAGPFEARLARMRAPTLVVRGTGDPVASGDWVRRVARTVADGRVAEVRGAAHAAHYSAPDTVAALIRAFAPKEREEREAASGGRG